MEQLIQRYIYATVKQLPLKIRDDVSQELNGLIEDMLVERCGENKATEKDVEIVLISLGSPSELAEKYDTSEKTCLIGQPYYSTYKMILKIVLICVVFGLTISIFILGLLNNQTNIIETFANWLAVLCSGVIFSFAIVTAMFAFFYHKDVQINKPFNVRELPNIPQKSKKIAKWEAWGGVAMSVIFVLVFLVFPPAISISGFGTQEPIMVFSQDLYNSWFIIVLFAVLGITREIIKAIEGQHNKKVMITALIVDAVSALLAFLWLIPNKILSSEFISSLSTIFPNDTIVVNLFSNFEYFFLGIIIFAIILDVLTVVVKTLKK